MSRLLAINANTRADATERIAAACRPYEAPGDIVEYVGVEYGPEGIDSLLDVAIAAVETARVASSRREEFDAFVVACANDPGVDVARQVTGKPVVGIAEAGMHLAMTLGARFSIVTFLAAEIPWMFELATLYGVGSRLSSTVTLDLTTAEVVELDRLSLLERTRLVCEQAVERDRAEVIVLAGSLMVDLAPPLTGSVGVPVLSGMICGLRLASALAGMGAVTSRAYKYRTPEKLDALIGYDDFRDVYGSSAADLRHR